MQKAFTADDTPLSTCLSKRDAGAILREFSNALDELIAAMKYGCSDSEGFEESLDRAALAWLAFVRPLGIVLTIPAAADFCVILAAIYATGSDKFPAPGADARRSLRAAGIDANVKALRDYARIGIDKPVIRRRETGEKPQRLHPNARAGGRQFGMDGGEVIFKAKRSADGVSLIFTCPSCGEENSHGAGGPKFGAGDGHRVSHCPCWPRGYILREATE
jgi:hypothetical protein